MKLLFSSQSAPEVGLLRGLLEEVGISCEVRNETVYAILPGAAFQPEIWVLNDADWERACEIRDGWRQSFPSQIAERGAARDSRLNRLGEILKSLSANQTKLVNAMVQLEQMQDLTSKLSMQVSLLLRWRLANTDLIEMMESSIDESIVSLTHFEEIAVEQLKALQFAKQYRAKYPRTTCSREREAEIARALGRVKENDD